MASEVLIRPEEAEGAVPVHALGEAEAAAYLERAPAFLRALAAMQDFKAKAGQVLAATNGDGRLDRILFGLGGADRPDPMIFRALAARLPSGDYRLAAPPPAVALADAAAGFALGAYRFDRYRRSSKDGPPRFVVADPAALAEARRLARACALARDMVNTPAADMGPLQIETIARELAEQYGAGIETTAGEALEAGYPAVAAVGRAAAPDRAPRIVELTWGDPDAPRLCLVGKGVCFDTGGLDIKSTAGMRLMKKDMGGAACVLALARLIMDEALPVRLTVLVPAVENAISGAAMRPGDVLASRKGLSVEVGNTDAEGRLILADALARAAELSPVLTVDMATLTGAARIALGPQVVPFYTPDDALAADLAEASLATGDPLWRMPLWPGYAEAIEGDISDLKNDPDAWAQAGSVTAALFLQRFAPEAGWIHLDVFAWNGRARPGWPVGGEAQAVRALHRLVRKRFA